MTDGTKKVHITQQHKNDTTKNEKKLLVLFLMKNTIL
jgi:hypothetical protein